jgi:hypothetical protein
MAGALRRPGRGRRPGLPLDCPRRREGFGARVARVAYEGVSSQPLSDEERLALRPIARDLMVSLQDPRSILPRHTPPTSERPTMTPSPDAPQGRLRLDAPDAASHNTDWKLS